MAEKTIADIVTEELTPDGTELFALSDAGADKKMQIANIVKALKLDDFVAPDDNTDLDALTTRHGLMPKLDKVKLDKIIEPIEFQGVADYATTKTDNTSAFEDAFEASRDNDRPVIIKAGDYWVASPITIDPTADITMIAEQGARIIWDSFAGSALTFARGFQTTTTIATTGVDAGTVTVNTAAVHGASIGDQVLLEGAQADDNWGYDAAHCAIVTAVPTTTSLTMDAASIFNFAIGDSVKITTVPGKIRIFNLAFHNDYQVATRVVNVHLKQVNGAYFHNCAFTTSINPAGTSDPVEVLESHDVGFLNCYWEDGRYAVLCNRSTYPWALHNRCDNHRHFITPASFTRKTRVSHLWGYGNNTLVDGHQAIDSVWSHVRDYGAVGSDLFNCRSIGLVLDDVEWEYIGTDNVNTVHISSHTMASAYASAPADHDVILRNVKLRNSGTGQWPISINNARNLIIENMDCGGQNILLGRDAGSEVGIRNDFITGLANFNTKTRRRSPFRARTEPPRHYNQTQKDHQTLTGTATAGSINTITFPVGSSTTDDFYLGGLVRITGGTGTLHEFRRVTAYVGSTRVATVDTNWTIAPDATTTFDWHRYDFFAAKEENQVAFQWSRMFAELTGVNTVGGDNSINHPTGGAFHPIRIRVYDQYVEFAKQAGRWQNTRLRFHVLTTAEPGGQPYKKDFTWDINHKSVPTEALYGVVDLPIVGDTTQAIYATLTDLTWDAVNVTPVWWEGTLNLTALANAWTWLELDIHEGM